MSPRFKNISTLFFDGAGTLFHVRGGVGKIYAKLARPYGVEVSPETLEKRFRREFRAAPPPAFPGAGTRRLEREKAWWYDRVAAVFRKNGFGRFDDFFEELFEFFREAKGWRLYPEVKPVLHELKQRGYRMEIISNFDSRIYDVCRALGIESYLDRFHLSSRIGSAKPDRRIFHRALIECGCHPWQTVHIGDHLTEDVAGALGAGLHAVWLDRSDPEKERGRPGAESGSGPRRKKEGRSTSGETVPSGALRISTLNELLIHFPPKIRRF